MYYIVIFPMKKLLTLRMPTTLIDQLNKIFPAKNQTEQVIHAIEAGLKSQKTLEEKMIADYKSINYNNLSFIREADAIYQEEDEDFDEYLKLLK